MRVIVVVVALVAGCTEQPAHDPPPDPIFLGAVPTSAPCRTYEDLADAHFSLVAPFIAPVKTGERITVSQLNFYPLWGEGDVYLDAGQQPIGTLVWGPKELHETDGSMRLGAAGRVGAATDQCRWFDAANVLQ